MARSESGGAQLVGEVPHWPLAGADDDGVHIEHPGLIADRFPVLDDVHRGQNLRQGRYSGLRAIPPMTRDSEGAPAKTVFSSGCHAGT